LAGIDSRNAGGGIAGVYDGKDIRLCFLKVSLDVLPAADRLMEDFDPVLVCFGAVACTLQVVRSEQRLSAFETYFEM
jgi:hypothetical protein